MSQYIGKTISLVSNSDIRYMGTLHEINSELSTVSLRNVRSFGTEGRRDGKTEIPPSENVYEFIVFRGSDVKDLKIADSQPPPPPPPQPFHDPAIMNAEGFSQPPYGYPAYPPAGYPPQHYGYPPQMQVPNVQPQTSVAPGYPTQNPTTISPAASAPASVAPTAPPAPAVPQNTKPKPVESASVAETQSKSVSPAVPPPAQAKPVPSSYVAAAAPANAKPTERPRNNNSRSGHKGPIGNDFDFEENNAKLLQDDKKESVIPPTDEFYNKKSSFFDNISSTAKDRAEGGGEQQTASGRRGQEQKLNMETFGQSHVNHRRGGRGRGRGGRGRGGQNRGNYSEVRTNATPSN